MNQYYTVYPDELYHHGIKNQKWGQRRFQNYDGTLTEEGMLRYGRGQGKRKNKSIFGFNLKNKKKSKKAKGTKKEKNNDSKSKEIMPTKENNFYDGKRTNAKAIQNNLGTLSTEEIQNLITRINTEKTLSDIVKSQQPPSTAAKIDKLILNLDKQYKTINTLYTTVSTSKLAKDICDALDWDSSWVKPNADTSTIKYSNNNNNNNNSNNNNNFKKKK